MAKRYDICSLCGARALLNYALLCKRCNKSKESTKLKAAIFKHDHEMIEDAKEEAIEDAAEAAAEAKAAAKAAPAEGADAKAEGKGEHKEKKEEKK